MTHEERLESMRRPADYPLTIALINPLNRKLVGPLHRMGVSPTAVTLASFGLAILAGVALFLASGRILWACVAAPLLVFLSHVCDALDGDLARYSGRKSTFGAALDPILDRAGEVIYILAVALGLSSRLPDPTVWMAAMVCISGILVYYYTTDAQISRVMNALPNDPKRYGVLLGPEEKTRVKLGLYEPFMYGFAIATSLGTGYWALWFFAATFWIAWLGQMIKLFRVSTRIDEGMKE